jgi:hypothetical protein
VIQLWISTADVPARCSQLFDLQEQLVRLPNQFAHALTFLNGLAGWSPRMLKIPSVTMIARAQILAAVHTLDYRAAHRMGNKPSH